MQGVALTFQQLARLKCWLKGRPAAQTRHSSTFKLRKTVRDWSLYIIWENTPWKTQLRYYQQQAFVQNQGTIFVFILRQSEFKTIFFHLATKYKSFPLVLHSVGFYPKCQNYKNTYIFLSFYFYWASYLGCMWSFVCSFKNALLLIMA